MCAFGLFSFLALRLISVSSHDGRRVKKDECIHKSVALYEKVKSLVCDFEIFFNSENWQAMPSKLEDASPCRGISGVAWVSFFW